jgi:hypothetical protein
MKMNKRDFVIKKDKSKAYINPENNLGLKEGDYIDNLTTLTMTISGKMKVIILDPNKELGILLPSNDIIYIPADDHPFVNISNTNYPIFTYENILDWHVELVDGGFHLIFENDNARLILITKINADTIEYDIITSRLNRNVEVYYPETVRVILTMTEARNLTFIPLTDIN